MFRRISPRRPASSPKARSQKASYPPHRLASLALPTVLLAGLALTLFCFLLSLTLGSRPLTLEQVAAALLAPDASLPSIIIWDLRLPRALAALLVGAGLAAAGVLMQALTRNPLAEPGLLGVNAGAALAVVAGSALLGISPQAGRLWLACAGAATAALLVGWIGLRPGPALKDPRSQLLLTGLALGACASALTGSITIFDAQALDSHRFWMVGSMAERSYQQVGAVAPLILLGILLALTLIKPLSALRMGEDTAAALGVPVGVTKLLTLLALTLLCGGATALAGPIGFVGLLVPHALRILVGPRLERVLPLSLIFGPLLLLVSDVLGRLLLAPAELEVGIVTALLGAPLLLALVLRPQASSPPCPTARRLLAYRTAEGPVTAGD